MQMTQKNPQFLQLHSSFVGMAMAEYLQPYAEALQERMVPFDEECWAFPHISEIDSDRSEASQDEEGKNRKSSKVI